MSLKDLNLNFNNIPKTFPNELEDNWVAIMNGKIVANNKDFTIIFNETSKKGIAKKVIFHKVPKKEIIIV